MNVSLELTLLSKSQLVAPVELAEGAGLPVDQTSVRQVKGMYENLESELLKQ